MKKFFLLVLVIFMMGGCGSAQNKTSTEPATAQASEKIPADKKILVLYFSRTGEEYGVGNITKGNTAIVAEILARKLNADTFEIKPATPYPNAYKACTELAKQELEANARPKFVGNIDNLAQYDTIFLGYPIWWGAVPRVVLTFLEANNFSGKKIIPFCTHAGSGLAGTEREISNACPNAEVLHGFDIRGTVAQSDAAQTERMVVENLKRRGF